MTSRTARLNEIGEEELPVRVPGEELMRSTGIGEGDP